MMMLNVHHWWHLSVRLSHPHHNNHPGVVVTPCLHHLRKNISKDVSSFMLKMYVSIELIIILE